MSCTTEDIIASGEYVDLQSNNTTLLIMLGVLSLFDIFLIIFIVVLLKKSKNSNDKQINKILDSSGSNSGSRNMFSRSKLKGLVSKAKDHAVADSTIAEYEAGLLKKQLKAEKSILSSKSRLARRLEERESVGEFIDGAKLKVSKLGRDKLTQLSAVLILPDEPEFLDGSKVLSVFYKLKIDEPERVLMALSRGNGGHI